MVSLFGGGNVDLLARPMIDAAKLVEKDGKMQETVLLLCLVPLMRLNKTERMFQYK